MKCKVKNKSYFGSSAKQIKAQLKDVLKRPSAGQRFLGTGFQRCLQRCRQFGPGFRLLAWRLFI